MGAASPMQLLALGSERLAEKNITSMLIADTANNATNGINMYKGYTAWYLNRGQEADPYRTGPPLTDEQVLRHIPQPYREVEYLVRVYLYLLIFSNELVL